ncbi:MAG: haloalkane dehalogenase, partial [Bacteroidota bacterium]
AANPDADPEEVRAKIEEGHAQDEQAVDGLRQAYAETGPADGEVVLLLHGQPSWSYLYRKMMPVLADAGYRVIAMDHLGMGRSDKPIDIDDYTYLGHNDRLEQFIQELGVTDINLFVQDWGSLIGLRVAGLNPEWFATIAVGNGALPVLPAGTEVFPPVENPNDTIDIPSPFAALPDQQVPFYDACTKIAGPEDESYFGDWMTYAMKAVNFNAAEVLEGQTWFPLSDQVEAAYNAPFPSREYMAGVRKFPSLINEVPGETQTAYMGLTNYEKPFLTIWADNDPGGQGSCETQQSWIDNVPGAKGKPHARLSEASHFLQDDQGAEIARRLVQFYNGDYTEGNFGNTEDTQEEICESDPNDDPRRYCEILLAYQRNGALLAEVWGTQSLNNCPAQCLDNIDLDAIKTENGALMATLNGPRIWLPRGEADFPDVEPKAFGGLEMRLLATVALDPTDLSSGEVATAYEENLVSRNTQYLYPAGSEVYELTSPEGAIYTMQSVSLIIDSNLRLSDLPNLGSRLELPEGWTYQARMLEEDLILTADGEATVITDDLGNTYQKRAEGARVGFEVLQIISQDEIKVWLGLDVTLEEFEALEVPQGWLKNQSREGDVDAGSFARSPNAEMDGEFTDEAHFGYTWRHNATIVDMEVELPETEDLLSGRLIAKYHDVQFNAGKTLKVLVSPDGEYYIRISRDAGRTQEIPTIPNTWQEIEVTLTEDLILQLPNPTLNIRADNEDSYQGPVAAELLGL